MTTSVSEKKLSKYLKVKLNDGAELPKRAHEGDAGLDLVAGSVELKNGQLVVSSKVCVAIPNGYVGLLFQRSSVCKTGCRLSNGVGVIDAPYRGEIKAVFDITEGWLARLLAKCGLKKSKPMYEVGDRFAQLLILRVDQWKPLVCKELNETERGEGGYGSSGK